MKVLGVTFGLLLAGMVIAFYVHHENAQPQRPSIEQVSKKIGFKVLVPNLPSLDYHIEEYWIADDRLFILDIRGPQSAAIRITQSQNSKDRDERELGEAVSNLFEQYNPREVLVLEYTGYMLTKPALNSDNSKHIKILTWDDDQRHVNIGVIPASALSDDELFALAASLYW